MNTIKTIFMAIALVLGVYGSAHATSATCTQYITSVPYTITTSGVYCLGGGFVPNGIIWVPTSYNANAITVSNVGDVTIDLNGFELFCAGSYCSSATGIYLPGGYAAGPVVVTGGIIDQFGIGIYVGTWNTQISNVTINLAACGVYLDGNSFGATIRDSKISAGIGVQSWFSSRFQIINNIFDPISNGIYIDGSANLGIIKGNIFYGSGHAINCNSGCTGSQVVYRDNMAGSWMTSPKYFGTMTNGGNNF